MQNINSFFEKYFIYLLLVVLSLCCCSASSLVRGEWGGDSLVALHRLFIAVAPHVAGFPGGLDGKESAFQRERPGFDP